MGVSFLFMLKVGGGGSLLPLLVCMLGHIACAVEAGQLCTKKRFLSIHIEDTAITDSERGLQIFAE